MSRKVAQVHAEGSPRRVRVSKRRVNVSVRSDMLDEARRANINLSGALEEALAVRLKLEAERRWLEENREAIAEYNAYVGKYGQLSDDYRRF